MRVNPTKCQSETLRMERSKGNWNHHLMWLNIFLSSLAFWISSSIIDTWNNTSFDERLPGSNASCSNCCFVWFDVWPFIRSLVGLQVDFLHGSFVGLLIDSTNWIQWLTWTRFPVAELRLIKVSLKFAKRKIAKNTKNLERAVIAVRSFALQCFNYNFLNPVSFCFACVT